jgi:predicted alpha/beta superfamily hydrolase
VHSDTLGEDRSVLVYTPPGYEHGDTAYPVLYLLDGDGHLLHTAGIIQFLSANGYMPEMLVVAIPNTDRTRDLTPATAAPQEDFPTAGGADAFLAFIGGELMPHIEGRYRTAPFTVLVGHSFGGLLAIHALMARPGLFDAFLAISPSLWWDDGALVGRMQDFLAAHPAHATFLYMTMGNEGGAMLGSAREMTGILEADAPDTFTWHFRLMEDETHGSIPHRSTYHGLEELFRPWRIDRSQDLSDMATYERHYEKLSKTYGYEIRIPEETLNQLGYRMLGQERIDAALAAFERNAALHPNSANAYDSLGDAYDAAGRPEDALRSYETAVRIARQTGHPNLGVYEANLQRLQEKR